MTRSLRLGALLLMLGLAAACGSKDAGQTAKAPAPAPAPAAATGFRLSKDKPVMLLLFSAPASRPGGDLPVLFHDQLIFALHAAGFSAEDAVPYVAPEGLSVAPLPDPAAAETAKEKDARPAPEPEQATVPGYALSGRITTWRMLVGSSAQGKSSVEAACVYQLRDNESGRTLASGAAVGAGARAFSSGDPEEIRSDLAHKAMAAMARDIVARLTGKAADPADTEHIDQFPDQSVDSERGEYQDSPGKQLRPKRR